MLTKIIFGLYYLNFNRSDELIFPLIMCVFIQLFAPRLFGPEGFRSTILLVRSIFMSERKSDCGGDLEFIDLINLLFSLAMCCCMHVASVL